ncbi:ABC transporter ATP-binding protein [Roseiterribacter gracilis]|uniref:ABC transporter ATP-binding protein n=1 Tax=Roseiterribacter gracilis TaxID=2812848 RepID=A0A8S8X7W2_9PROT|nr:ABC transporter ATP-binding protein [Rhodospirillales bacterium TMPK1]
MNRVVTATSLIKRFGALDAVRDVSFDVPRGSICGVLGPNGAGKSTTLRMLLGLIEPTAGRIEILGASNALAVRERIGFLPEERSLYRRMQAREAIAYFGRLKGLRADVARKRAAALLEANGLGDAASRRIEALSKGMAQKVQLLATIVHQPDLLILDEPFSGLDPISQEGLEALLRDLAGNGTTILFSTHVMQHAERLCDRLLMIARGRKMFEGTLAEARATVPRRVRLRTVSSTVQSLTELASVMRVTQEDEPDRWRVDLRVGSDPQTLLAACFERRIELLGFEAGDPSLHDVFLHLAGPETA